MKMTTWAVLGSLLINVMLGVLIAAVFSASPAARAEACTGPHSAAHVKPAPASPTHTPYPRHGYLIAVRMGWAG